jgi:sporulation protein YlmC with PRC-barrel domain
MNQKHILFGGLLITTLALGACAPTNAELTVTSESTISTTGIPQTPLETVDSNNITPTFISETTATASGAAEATMMPTLEGTSTMVPEGTTTANANEPLFIRASDLIGLDVAGESSILLGIVNDVLVDEAGRVQYVVIDANPDLETSSSADSSRVAIPLDKLDLQSGYQQLLFLGNEADLRALTTVDIAAFDDDDDFIVGSQAGTPVANPEFNGLIRVSRFTDFDLRNTEDENLGEVEDLVIDIHAGAVEHTIVNFGGFLGIGEKSVAVPWADLQLMTLNTTNNEPPYFVLDVPTETLEEAPAIEAMEDTLPRWPNPISPTWNRPYDTFWQTAGN